MKIENRILTALLKEATNHYESGSMHLDLDNKDFSIRVSLTQDDEFECEIWDDDNKIELTPNQEDTIYNKLHELLKSEIYAEAEHWKDNSLDPYENFGIDGHMFI